MSGKNVWLKITYLSLFFILISLGLLFFPNVHIMYKSVDVFEKEKAKPNHEPVVSIYSDPTLNGSDPLVDNTMIPVYYDFEEKTWKKADPLEKWYDYSKEWWANVVIAKEEYREKYSNALPGEIINLDEILGFFVWIPRFEYKLFNVDKKLVKEQIIEINIVSKTTPKKTTIKNGEYYTHPAFTAQYKNGDTYELDGFWIAKFEPSLENNLVRLVPNKKPIASINMATMWKYATGIKDSYGLDTPSRIITNMEWGAIAYFTYSNYGKPGNNDFKVKRVYINNAMGSDNWDNQLTGCSAGTVSTGGSANCRYQYDVSIYGTGASSTGNIYGIYDLVGGSWECVMGLISGPNLPDNIGGYNGSLPKETRYYTLYNNGAMLDHTRGYLGDATFETKANTTEYQSWYGNLSYFATSSFPWIKRGGSFRGGGYSGLFDHGITDALPRGDKTFRTILSKH